MTLKCIYLKLWLMPLDTQTRSLSAQINMMFTNPWNASKDHVEERLSCLKERLCMRAKHYHLISNSSWWIWKTNDFVSFLSDFWISFFRHRLAESQKFLIRLTDGSTIKGQGNNVKNKNSSKWPWRSWESHVYLCKLFSYKQSNWLNYNCIPRYWSFNYCMFPLY